MTDQYEIIQENMRRYKERQQEYQTRRRVQRLAWVYKSRDPSTEYPKDLADWELELICDASVSNMCTLDVLSDFLLIIKHNQTLKPKIDYFIDHTFHRAIEAGNQSLVHFLWNFYESDNDRESMLSSVKCCGTTNEFYAFSQAVCNGHADLVEFLWMWTSPAEHNAMLLGSRCAAFIDAAARGHKEIVSFLWQQANKEQQFLLLHERHFAAFGMACANGQMDIVRTLWTSSNISDRQQMLSVAQHKAPDRENVLEYLLSYGVPDELNSDNLSESPAVAENEQLMQESPSPSPLVLDVDTNAADDHDEKTREGAEATSDRRIKIKFRCRIRF